MFLFYFIGFFCAILGFFMWFGMNIVIEKQNGVFDSGDKMVQGIGAILILFGLPVILATAIADILT